MAWRCLGGAAPLALPPARPRQCVQPRLRVQLPRCATLRALVVPARLRPSGRAYAPHWGAPRVRRLWRRRICRALGAPLPWRAPCGGSTGGTSRARVSRAAARPLRARPPAPRRNTPATAAATRHRGAPHRPGAWARRSGAPWARLRPWASVAVSCCTVRARLRASNTSKLYLTSGTAHGTISTVQNGRCNLLCCSLTSFNANKGYHIFPARVKWYPLFFSSFLRQLVCKRVQHRYSFVRMI